MVVLVVNWLAHAGKEHEVAAIFQKQAAAARTEPGCLMFQVHRHRDDPRRFLIYEQYKDDAALEAHRNTPHFLEYVRKQLPALGERVDGNLYQPLKD